MSWLRMRYYDLEVEAFVAWTVTPWKRWAIPAGSVSTSDGRWRMPGVVETKEPP